MRNIGKKCRFAGHSNVQRTNQVQPNPAFQALLYRSAAAFTGRIIECDGMLVLFVPPFHRPEIRSGSR
jgi:hypothetical protein